MRRNRIEAMSAAAALTLFLGGATQARAGDPLPQPPNDAGAAAREPADGSALAGGGGKDDWRIDFNTWIWLPGIYGDAGVRGRVSDVDASFSDILDASDSLGAFSARLEFGKGAWGGFVDGWFTKIGADDQSGKAGLADVDVTFKETILSFGVMYRVGEWQPGGSAAENRRNTTLDLYAGGRYTSIDIELDPANLPSESGDQSWIDPIVGAQLVLPFAERWHFRAIGDVGGFGVGSDFTWSATGVFGYDFHLFTLPATVYAGYRGVGWDYSDGSGSDEFTWDIVQHGPIIGFSLKF